MNRFWRDLLDRRRSHCTIPFNSPPSLIYIRALTGLVDCDFIATRELPIVIAYTAKWPNYLRTIVNLIPSMHFLSFFFLHNTDLYLISKIVWKYYENPFELDAHTPTRMFYCSPVFLRFTFSFHCTHLKSAYLKLNFFLNFLSFWEFNRIKLISSIHISQNTKQFIK